ncbi:oligosaccharide flippase family protein [Novosphingobium resinovorum]|uniref:oligosaccharide flippase family protein n=1 Tax=Novosphingobium resinovorum TaxID=158500 RepID=UPI002ED2774F|nr:oligosaccharide flippase family protein [Novosphingobium resinovorum]
MTVQATGAAWPAGSPRPGLAARLGALALRDTNVVVASVVLNNLLRAVSSMILTRLLAPEVFGISGVIASLQFTVALASDLGFQAFVVRQEDGGRKRFLDTVWTVALLRSVLLAAALAALALPVSRALARPDLMPLIAASSLVFLIEGLASTSLLSALRDRRILRLSVVEIAALVVQIAVSAGLAWLRGDYWAILGGMLAGAALKSLLSYAAFPDSARGLALDRATLRGLWAFARYVTGSSVIYLLVTQCDKLVLAKVMPLDQFGFYVLAGNLASAPLGFAANYASRVLYPSYAALWREGATDLRARFYARRRLPSLLYAAATGGIIGSAPLVVGVLYDPRYAEAALYLQILCVSSLLALPSCAANETLTATGRISATFEASMAKLAWLGLAGVAGYLIWGQFGLVLAVGLMEAAALGFKWLRMRQAGLLDMTQELAFLAAGAGGILLGLGADAVLGPLLR